MESYCRILPLLFNAINPYHWITWLRNRAFDNGLLKSRKFDIPVICIGNITVGGTGKTPHTEYLVKLLSGKKNTAVLSRGYGRRTKGYLMATTESDAATIGDEPLQIKKKFKDITVVVSEKRAAGIDRLLKEKSKTEVILLDDAFQHRYVKAGLNILLTDYNRPIWKDSLLPIGRLRESISGIKRADIIILTKCPKEFSKQEQDNCKKQFNAPESTPIFFSTMQYGIPYPLFDTFGDIDSFSGYEILLPTGIAKPEPLKKELEQRGAKVTLMQYADHHDFSRKDLQSIAKAFETLKGTKKIVVTTEKDAARLANHDALPKCIREQCYALPIEVAFLNNEENKFNQIILDYVTENSRNSRLLKG